MWVFDMNLWLGLKKLFGLGSLGWLASALEGMIGLSRRTLLFSRGRGGGGGRPAKGDIIDMPLAPSDMIMNEI